MGMKRGRVVSAAASVAAITLGVGVGVGLGLGYQCPQPWGGVALGVGGEGGGGQRLHAARCSGSRAWARSAEAGCQHEVTPMSMSASITSQEMDQEEKAARERVGPGARDFNRERSLFSLPEPDQGEEAANKPSSSAGETTGIHMGRVERGASSDPASLGRPDSDVETVSELTVYLLSHGATHYEVADMARSLRDQGSKYDSLSGWRGWGSGLDGMREAGFSGSDLAGMIKVLPEILTLDYDADIHHTMETLRKRLNYRPTDVRRVLRRAPEVLLARPDGSSVGNILDMLTILGIRKRVLRAEMVRTPELLACTAEGLFQVTAWLASDEIGIPTRNVGSLLKQAPWLPNYDIDEIYRPVVRFLGEVGVEDTERIIRAHPHVLLSDVEADLEPRVDFLHEIVGISKEDTPRVLQTFPLLLGVPLERMKAVCTFLTVEVSISCGDLAKIIRAFPSLLGLEPEVHMVSVVNYLRKLGVQNIGRFVSRLPPVLGYDVETTLVPKMDYLVSSMGLSVYDVLTFPAYLSYPLEGWIEPRTEVLKLRRRPISLVGLNTALTSGDADFAKMVAKVTPELYNEFKELYATHRNEIRSGKRTTESLIALMGKETLGSVGGLSTSSNVGEVTQAARLDDDAVLLREKIAFESKGDGADCGKAGEKGA